MALQVTINGVDYTRDIDAKSFRIGKFLNRKSNKKNFTIARHANRSTVPSMGQEVIATDGATRIFGGVITSIDTTAPSFGLELNQIECSGYIRQLSRRLVPETYENMTADAIIADLASRYFPEGFTTTNVDAPVLINYIAFNYKQLDKCLEELADLINYNFYVDDYKNVFFKANDGTTPAPFDVTDDNGSYTQKSLVIRKDNSQIRNTIVVRGGTYLAPTFTAEIEANGTDFVFGLPYRYSDFKATLTGQLLNIGVDNRDNPDEFDALHNFDEKQLLFREVRKPTAGSIIRASGRPNLPVIVKYRDPAAVATTSAQEGGDGIYEYLIVDKTINSREGARQRAQQEILAYANTLSEADFVTTTAGLVPGQRILLNSASRGINEYFIINRVNITVLANNELQYGISLITSKTYDLIDILSKILQAQTKDIEIDRDEVVDVVEAFSEEMTLSETFTAQALDYPMQTILGTFTGDDGFPNTPQGTYRVFTVGGSRLGVL